MTLLLELGKASAKGYSDLFIGLVASNLILAVGAIFVGRLLGSASYGLYMLSFVPASLLGLSLGFGVRNGIVRFVARLSFRDETEKVRRIVISGLFFVGLSASIFAVSSYLLSDSLAQVFGRPYASPLIEVYSITILTDALVVVSQSVFVGFQKMRHYSLLLILQALLRTTASLLLIVGGHGPFGAVVGYATSSIFTCFLALWMVYFMIRQPRRPQASHSQFKSGSSKLDLLKNLRTLTGFGFPLYLRNLITIGIGTQLLNFLMIAYTTDMLIGNYKVALNFQVLLSFFAIPVQTVLFPTFSKLDYESHDETLKTMFAVSVKYASLIIVPATAAVIVLSGPLVSTLYGQDYSYAPLFVSLSALPFLYSAFGEYSIPSFLSSQRETKKSMAVGASKVALAVPLALILVPSFQVVGLIVSLVVSGLPAILLGSFWIRKLYGISIDWRQALRILACAILASTLAYAIVTFSGLSHLLALVVGCMVLSSSFLFTAIVIGVIDSDDVYVMQSLLSEIGRASRLLDIPFRLLLWLCEVVVRARARASTQEVKSEVTN